MMHITATDLVTVRRDDLLAMESEIRELKRRLDVACHVEAGDKVGFDWAVLDEIAELREARDAAVLVAGVYQAQADALAEKVQAGIEYASRLGRIDNMLMIEKLGGTVEPREDAPMQVQCRQCHALYARRVDDKRGRPKFTVQANPLGVVDVIKTPHGFAVCCPECGAERALY